MSNQINKDIEELANNLRLRPGQQYILVLMDEKHQCVIKTNQPEFAMKKNITELARQMKEDKSFNPSKN